MNDVGKKKVSIYEIIQAQLLQKLEDAILSGQKFQWVKPWRGAPYPCSYAKPQKPFSAPINRILLDTGEYLTFYQISKLHEQNPDIKIKKGAKTVCVYQHIPVFKMAEGELLRDENGEPIIETFRLRYTREFHISDVEGLKSHFTGEEYRHAETEQIAMAETLIRDYCVHYDITMNVLYGGGEAYCRRSENKITVPDRKQYPNIYEYYSTVFHELGHITAKHSLRENLKLSYAQEELVAEVTAGILCARLNLKDERSIGNSIAYLQNWYSRIQDANPKEIYFAVNEAQKAAELILDSSPEVKKKTEPEISMNEEEQVLLKEEKESFKRNKKVI